jgi:hypothetical protein
MRLALIHDGVVVNVAEADESFAPESGLEAVASEDAGPGWRYDGRTFLPPSQKTTPPAAVSMFQAREALRRSPGPGGGNLLDAVETYIEEQRRNQPTLALAWEYATEVERNGLFVGALADVFSLDDAALDALFRLAATVAA